MKRTLVYGAAFNPITFAHLVTAEMVRSRRCIEKVVFMPSTSRRRDKSKELVSDEHRFNMIKLAIEDNNYFKVSDIELTNSAWESKTEVTLRKYKEQNPDEEVFFLMGADNLKQISTWDNAYDLIKNNRFIVMSREGFDMIEIIGNDPLLRKFETNFDLMHKGIRMDISSTFIREELKFGGSAKYLLPDKCLEYALENKLYNK